MSIVAQIEQEKELSRLVSIEDEIVTLRGHRPAWTYGEDGDDLIASAKCETCGQNLAARIFADGRAWSAGRLRVSECDGAA